MGVESSNAQNNRVAISLDFKIRTLSIMIRFKEAHLSTIKCYNLKCNRQFNHTFGVEIHEVDYIKRGLGRFVYFTDVKNSMRSLLDQLCNNYTNSLNDLSIERVKTSRFRLGIIKSLHLPCGTRLF